MRQLAILGAMLVCAIPTSAHAALYLVSINGLLTGTEMTVLCTSADPTCAGNALSSNPFSMEFNQPIGMWELSEGDTQFSFGHPRASGSYSGIITNTNGYLTGSNLYFATNGCFPTGRVGCSDVFAQAATFNVIGGIPEPATWAMMMIGFGTIGFSLRRRRKLALEYAA